MKKIIVILSALLLACAGAGAQRVTVSDLQTEKDGDRVSVTFRAEVAPRAVRGGETLILRPVMQGVDYSWMLPAIAVEGRRARVSNLRHGWASGVDVLQPAFGDSTIVTRNGSTLSYSATIPWQPWMDGARLVGEMLSIRCCAYDLLEDMPLAADLILSAPTVVDSLPAVAEAVPTTGEVLAVQHTFIAPYSDFEKLTPGKLFDEDRENTLTVYSRQGRYAIDKRFDDNEQALADMITSIRTLQASDDSHVRAVVIAGFASPEGTFNFNDRLAFDRAAEVKSYILEQTGLPDDAIMLYNGAEDWRGLRMLVEQSDMPSRAEVLRIIDTVPVWDSANQRGRESELMRLEGGRPYRYMYENFFPLLRNAAYIKIYYDNK